MIQKESYYKILGTTANIGNARIKEKYVEAVKKHPPETDPEGYEKVKEAYETLKDPEKRKQYDFERKYGSDLEKIIREAYKAFASGEHSKAKELFNFANDISGGNPRVLTGLMTIAVSEEDFQKMNELFATVLEMLPESETEEIAAIYKVKATVLMDRGLNDEAFKAIETAIKHVPEEEAAFAPVLARYYIEMEQIENAWQITNDSIPAPEDESIDDIDLFLFWSQLMLQLERWNDKAKVQSRIRKFLRNLVEDEEEIAYMLIMENYEDYYHVARYKEAEFFIDLARTLDSQDSELKKMQNEIKKLARVQNDLERLDLDEDIFPLITFQALEWFYKDTPLANEYKEMFNRMPPEVYAALEENKEMYAAGIIHLKKKYPSVYKHYKEDWDRKFEELTAGFKREMKRNLWQIK